MFVNLTITDAEAKGEYRICVNADAILCVSEKPDDPKKCLIMFSKESGLPAGFVKGSIYEISKQLAKKPDNNRFSSYQSGNK